MTIALYELIAQLLSKYIHPDQSNPVPMHGTLRKLKPKDDCVCVCIVHVWCGYFFYIVVNFHVQQCQSHVANWNAQPTCNRKQATVASIHAHKMPIPKMTLNSRRRCANHLFARLFHTYKHTNTVCHCNPIRSYLLFISVLLFFFFAAFEMDL